jgi:hypothetical protein
MRWQENFIIRNSLFDLPAIASRLLRQSQGLSLSKAIRPERSTELTPRSHGRGLMAEGRRVFDIH